MINFGKVAPGSTLYIPFASYDGATGASEAISGLAVTDIEIYKDGSVTQRASDAGYTLLDTDGIDFDGIVGINGFSINLADNTTSGFFVNGGRYWVIVSSVTADAQTVNFIAAIFRLGVDGSILDTTIATLASQTSFTLTAGSADNNAYIGCTVYIHDIASGVQCAMGVVSAYTGSTKTVTLAFDPSIFTIAAGDNISIFPRVNSYALGSTVQTGRDLGSSVLLSPGTGTGQVSLSSGSVTVGTNSDKTGYSLTVTPPTAAQIQAELEENGASLLDTIRDEVQSATYGLSALKTLIDAITAYFTTNRAEPGQGAPAASTTFLSKIDYLYKTWRNEKRQTSNQWSLYNDAGDTVDQKSTVSDDSSTTIKGEIVTGP